MYVYNGANLIEEADAGANLVARYVFGSGLDEHLAAYRGATWEFYQADGLGSITSLSTTAGTVSDNFVYDSFGNVISSTGSFSQPFRYTGREWDAETGLYYYRARYYDPQSGRFLSEDPLRFMAGGSNFYQYVNNNPVNFTDPRGLQTKVFVIYDNYLGVAIGSHSAVYIDNGGNPMLYDPAGSYTDDKKCGSENVCSEKDADPSKYKNYHQNTGSTVRVFTFNTTTAQEAQIATNIDKVGGADPPYCTISVTKVLSGVGPFKDLPSIFLPGNLADALDALQNPKPQLPPGMLPLPDRHHGGP